MTKKKLMMSVTAGAAIASAVFAAEEVDAASYKVQPGDSLWSIAQKFNTSVTNLKTVNNLSGDIIFPNQVLETEKKQTSNSNSTTTKPNTSTTTSKSTYTVKAGDTLSGIAFQHKVSIADLMKWNKLNSTLIYPGNVFVVSAGGSTASNSGTTSSGNSSTGSSSSSAGSSQVGSTTVYTVKSGDTLSGIASRHGVTVANLKKWNKLSSDLILIGQKLNIGEGTVAGTSTGTGSTGSGSNAGSGSSTVDVSYDVNKLIAAAKSQLGVGYAWGGQTSSGFDCSGYIFYAYNQAGMKHSRLSSDGYFNRSYYVNTPQVGDLVFFEGTYRAGISHLGIYIGNNEFIHASSSGVIITNLNNSYWKSHFHGFKRFY